MNIICYMFGHRYSLIKRARVENFDVCWYRCERCGKGYSKKVKLKGQFI